MMQGGNYGMGFGWIMGIVVLAIVVLGLVFLFGYFQQSRGSDLGPKVGSPLDILNERYAKGEISEEEYRIKKSKLM